MRFPLTSADYYGDEAEAEENARYYQRQEFPRRGRVTRCGECYADAIDGYCNTVGCPNQAPDMDCDDHDDSDEDATDA